ncbi:hypothetical protein [Flavobacteriaceae bacterium 14752]|uniref:hypothetical protein n=1 Tax=Mesohalobacter salilacus TaxID=2491711 RepID=UPI000F63230B|nr:hypothetical protein EIG84_05930 [Flavobacteriaceae bacterium 14752]
MKNIILLSIIGAGFWALNSIGNKKNEIINISKKLKFKPFWPSKINLKNGKLNIKSDLEIVNTSTNDFTLDGVGLMTIKKIILKLDESGQAIGTALTDIKNISVPAGGNIVIKNVDFEVSLNSAFDKLGEIIFSNPKFFIDAEIEVLGKKMII